MPQPHDVRSFRPRPDVGRVWRVAHISDIHVVGERYGFRISSGRSGPRGNECFIKVLERLDEIHRARALDAIVLTGDLTDAGRSTEFAELLDSLALFPGLADLFVAVPGNHDLNVVDRANPARLDLPMSPKKRLRQIRTLSTLDAIQGNRVRLTDGTTLADTVSSHLDVVTPFADRGRRRASKPVDELWASLFPMVRLPDRDDGLGIIALDSNAETHFSFTNALGLVSAEQAKAVDTIIEQYPRACWIVALHHHIVEHPALAHALAERIGTTLINGSWFTRRLLRVATRVVVMHGHRHIDWIGQCGDLMIVSAPSQVMRSSDEALHFYVHTLGASPEGRLELFEPERIDV
jgi:predicted phosphodiesterase